MSVEKFCSDRHRIFVAERVGVPAEGTVAIITVCLDCPYNNMHKFQVAQPNHALVMGSMEDQNKKSKEF